MRDIASQNQEIRTEVNESQAEVRNRVDEVTKSPCIAERKREISPAS